MSAALLPACTLPPRAGEVARETDAPLAAHPSVPIVDVRIASEPPPAAATPVEAETPAPGREPVLGLLDFADRVRTLGPFELQGTIARLAEIPDTQRTPVQEAKLAISLGQTRSTADIGKALSVLQRLQANGSDAARRLHPFARLLAARYNEQKRADDQGERLAQQLRDSQRRIDQLNERLEAMRAIERSLAPRPSSLLGRPAAAAVHAGTEHRAPSVP
jgi:hypothetical protein